MVETADDAIQHTLAWFEPNSGWVPPGHDDRREWVDDGVCRARRLHVAPDHSANTVSHHGG